MKIKILKPNKTSGYFKNVVIDVTPEQFEFIIKNNDVEVIDDSINLPTKKRNGSKVSKEK